MVPAQDGVGSDDGGDACENAATENLALRSESAALVIRESESLAAQLLLQDTVLLDEVVDDLRLMTIDPAGERGEEELE